MAPRVFGMVALLGVLIFINYIDRGNLSTAAPLVKSELNLTASQLGFLLTAFFITYMPVQPFVGWLVDRMGASRVLVTGFLLWSLATILSGFAGGFAALFACRLLLGLGESVTFPAVSHSLVEYISETQRGFANGIVLSGISFGPAFGIFFGGMAIAAYGWRPFFIAFGAISLLWVAAWLAIAQRGQHQGADAHARAAQSARVEFLLREPSLWGASVGAFCSNYLLYFLLTWIPYYLVHERHWTLPQMARIGGTTFLLMGVTMVCSGLAADYFIRRGVTPTVARKTVFGIGAVVAAVSLLGVGYSNDLASVFWLFGVGIGDGFLHANNFVVGQTIAGPEAAGRWAGIQNTLSNISGIIAPSLTGILVDRTGSFVMAFTIAAVLALFSGAAWIFLVGKIAPIDWSRKLVPSLRPTPT
ncbi:MAG TPA: MFS transporter [Candidatus Cybelea sp.]